MNEAKKQTQKQKKCISGQLHSSNPNKILNVLFIYFEKTSTQFVFGAQVKVDFENSDKSKP